MQRAISVALAAYAMIVPGMAFAATEPAPCPEGLICASDPEAVAEELRKLGYRAELNSHESGDPQIRSAAAGYDYRLNFNDCTENTRCRSLGFVIVFADDGKYAAKLKDEDGELTLVRTDDGVHFTAAGGERLARVVFAAMDRSWRLQAQAVPGAIQTIEQTAGCCTTPSGSNNTQWQTGPTPTRPRSASPSTTAGTTATTTAKAPSTTVAAPTTPSSQPLPSSPTTPTAPAPQPTPDPSSGE